MRIKPAPLLAIFFTVMLFACRKENIKTKELYSKWILIEIYDPYYGGATWHTVQDIDSHSLEFTAVGQFKKIENANGAAQECTGTYQLLPGNKIEVLSNCQPVMERFTISELNDKLLIIDIQGTEGIIRYKYKNAG